MVLSERERRLLQEMETHLRAEDPSLALSLSGRRLRIAAKAALALSGLVVGALLMAAGVWQGKLPGVAIAMLGFVILLISTAITVERLRARAPHGSFLRRATRRARPTP